MSRAARRRDTGLRSLSLGLPVVGTFIHKTIVARFARTTGTLVRSGIEVSAALDAVLPVTGSPVYERR